LPIGHTDPTDADTGHDLSDIFMNGPYPGSLDFHITNNARLQQRATRATAEKFLGEACNIIERKEMKLKEEE
jgi:hypothetical protein